MAKDILFMEHVLAILLAYIIDAIIGDPRTWPHPVKWFGKLIHTMEVKWNRGNKRKLKGFLMLTVMIILTLTVSLAIILVAYKMHLLFGIIIEAILIATTIAQKGLKDASLIVYDPLNDKDINKARENLAEIVGRDTNNLKEPDIVRATVETVAENTSDGITAPLFWAFIGGAPLALVYRAINTCDSMVGYKNEQFKEFGWAAAKLDDIVNYLPARITAFLMLIVNKPKDMQFLHTWSFIQQDAKRHASPNSGWLEATVAYILRVRLGGDNYYDGIKKRSTLMGTLQEKHRLMNVQHIKDTIQIMQRTVLLTILLILVGGMMIELTITWR